MFAGTSTGSILATSMVVPKEKGSRHPRYWGTDAIKIYENSGKVIFQQNRYGWWLHAIIYFSYTTLMGILFYYIGLRKYQNHEQLTAYHDIQEFLLQTQQYKMKKDIVERMQDKMKNMFAKKIVPEIEKKEIDDQRLALNDSASSEEEEVK